MVKFAICDDQRITGEFLINILKKYEKEKI